MNRQCIVNLLISGFLILLLALVAITTDSFFAPTLVRDFVGDVSIVAAMILLVGMVLGVVIFEDRIYDWFEHRYELSDQSPSRNVPYNCRCEEELGPPESSSPSSIGPS